MGGRHFPVQGRQHLVLQLDNRGGNALTHEVLDQLQADEPGPDDDGLLDALVHAGLDAVHVLQVAQREDAGQVDAGHRGPQGRCPGCEDQFVVALLVIAPRGQVADTYELPGPVDGKDGAAHAHIEVEARPQALRRDDEQLVALGNFAAQVVGQAAVGERHVEAALEQDDVGVLRQASGPGGCRGAAGHAADNEQFHVQTSCAPQHVGEAACTWFHGMRASSKPMPQVSVMPAKTSPAPTKPARPRNAA